MATQTKSKANKTEAPKITREEFRENASGVEVSVGGQTLIADPKEFKTQSLGWYAGGKAVMKIGDTPCKVQIGVTVTVIGSKELPKS